MKAGVFAVAAAALVSGVVAGEHRAHAARRHAHEAFHMERGLNLTTAKAAESTCGCTTVYYTVTGEGVRMLKTRWNDVLPSTDRNSLLPTRDQNLINGSPTNLGCKLIDHQSPICVDQLPSACLPHPNGNNLPHPRRLHHSRNHHYPD
jgi:hypothetical protein